MDQQGGAWLSRVRQGSVDSAPDCCTAVPGSIPLAWHPPSLGKLLQKVPRRLFAQRRKNHHSEENLMRMNLAKYCTIKVEK